MKKNTMLMILDGYGLAVPSEGNAIALAKTPNLDHLFQEYPHSQLGASGLSVGLPDGQMGNSEVGHLNIGAGRVVYQELTKITKAINEGRFFENEALSDAMDHVLENDSALHLCGLLSDGGVHSHLTHLFALIDMAKQKGVSEVYVHALLDGRDVPPCCAKTYVEQLEDYMKEAGVGTIATITGRYYAMDRDNRWERVVLAYDALTLGEGETAESACEAVDKAYTREEKDEFVRPTVILKDGAPVATVNDGDAFVFFNYRPDRAREITRCFVDDNFSGFERKKTVDDLMYICFTQYDATMPNVKVAFPPQSLDNTLGQYLAANGKKQLRIAETEKYAHVTFFFNGGVEAPNEGEDRILVPSPKVATYDLQPEMSAYEVTDRVLEQIAAETYDTIILNFANCDMVGHTGVLSAAIASVEAVDTCIGKIVEALKAHGGRLLLTADHGNADCMLDENGCIVTAHSLNPVPVLVLDPERSVELEDGGVLADLAPTLLDLMDMEAPAEMTGHSLIKK
ncbi:MAG: 2,3-bisphosphoglycerate-independent phosphoglycerate mutase [Firmicutes bacterium]|nr:2,3-bisphosphoglycerate-independent phosphoglycerate mutase [Bacillota bacterium]